MTTSSPLKTPATNSTVTVGPDDVGVSSTERSLERKGGASCLLVSLKLKVALDWAWGGCGQSAQQGN